MLKNCAAKIDLPHFLFFHNSINYADHNCIQIFFVAKKKDSMNWRDKKIYYILFSSRSLEVEATTTRKFYPIFVSNHKSERKIFNALPWGAIERENEITMGNRFSVCIIFSADFIWYFFFCFFLYISIVSSGSFIYISYYV